MKKPPQGFSLIEILVALVIAGISLSWFLYVLSHSYYTSARLFERLKLFDAVSPFRAYLLTELKEGAINLDELENFSDDPLTFSSYTTLPEGKVALQINRKEKNIFFENSGKQASLQEYNLILQNKDLAVHLLWQFYSWQDGQP
ncbi:prepilin-type N-terminal cleavage/methylation domain-containing protein [Thermodesulfatator atlanticus]|uniref:prepilin-type N-terminal cleavage/methylation domain-containing protein n=1 Tax=Thermodesulfatator atlanticus TaxID=501497 RepID=UPI0003B515D3|nr:prepilin-type N-terminal cleavage/methylation domain-containing protein [Thermodesulfatator atlanticus]